MKAFTEDELIMISDALILAGQHNSDAWSLTTSRAAQQEIKKEIDKITELNSKVGSMMKGGEVN